MAKKEQQRMILSNIEKLALRYHLNEIAYAHDLHPCYLSIKLRENGISFQRLRRQKLLKATMYLFQQRKKPQEIGERLHIHPLTVLYLLRLQKVKFPRGGPRNCEGWEEKHWGKIEELNPEVFG
jgi:hypothetical protein